MLLWSSVSEQILACSCIGQRTVKEEIKHADAVVVGTILSKQFITLTDSNLINSLFPKLTIARYALLVQDIYKGKITIDTVTIYTGVGGGDCGIVFEIGKKYIVYGKEKTFFGQVNNDFKFPQEKNSFWTYHCLRTTVYNEKEIVKIKRFSKKQHR